MKKYYKVKVYTPYVGEETIYFIEVEEEVEDHFGTIDEVIDEWIYENASQWWDAQSSDEYEEDFDAYMKDCGHVATEITEEEFFESVKCRCFTSIDLER